MAGGKDSPGEPPQPPAAASPAPTPPAAPGAHRGVPGAQAPGSGAPGGLPGCGVPRACGGSGTSGRPSSAPGLPSPGPGPARAADLGGQAGQAGQAAPGGPARRLRDVIAGPAVLGGRLGPGQLRQRRGGAHLRRHGRRSQRPAQHPAGRGRPAHRPDPGPAAGAARGGRAELQLRHPDADPHLRRPVQRDRGQPAARLVGVHPRARHEQDQRRVRPRRPPPHGGDRRAGHRADGQRLHRGQLPRLRQGHRRTRRGEHLPATGRWTTPTAGCT